MSRNAESACIEEVNAREEQREIARQERAMLAALPIGHEHAPLLPAFERCVEIMDAMDLDDDSEFCQGCNPEPTIGELENGRCDSCGKELPL